MTEGYTLGARGHKTQRGGWRDHSETEESKNNSEQVFKIGERDGIVVTGTIPLEQIYNLIDDDIKTHTHAQVSEKCAKINPREADFFSITGQKTDGTKKKIVNSAFPPLQSKEFWTEKMLLNTLH